MAALGIRSVPVVVLPGRPPILGFNPGVLGAAIGIAGGRPAESPDVLWRSFDGVLAGVIRATAQLRGADLDVATPNRDRTLRELVHDVFYKALLWTDDRSVPEGARAPHSAAAVAKDEARQKEEAARYRDGAALEAYGRAARARLRRCFSPESGTDYGRTIDTPEGPMTVAEAVAWLASHSAHHLRQIYWLMEHDLGISPADPLAPAALPGVTLPDSLW